MQRRKRIVDISLFAISKSRFSSSSIKPLTNLDFPYSKATDDDDDDPLYADVPKPRKDKSERKPYPTPMKELIRRAKEEKQLRKSQPCRVLEHPPDNGLLVHESSPMPRLVRLYHLRADGIIWTVFSILILGTFEASIQFDFLLIIGLELKKLSYS